MAQHTRHPIAAPPEAPARESSRRLLLRAHAILLVVTTFSLPALYLAFGVVAAAIVVIALTLGTISWWVPRIVRRRAHDPFPWRRLPWVALGYVAWSGLSIAWSQWAAASAVTWAGLVAMTINGLFLASALSWRELVKVLASGLKWAVGLSLLFELYVGVVLRHPIFPLHAEPVVGDLDPQWYWSRGNLLTGGRIQGIVGNANLLAMICLIAILVFAIRLASKSARRGWLVGWIAVAGYLFYRADSTTTTIALAAALGVLATVLIMRTARTPNGRTLRYFLFFGAGALVVVAGVFLRERIFAFFGKTENLTGRAWIWDEVWQRASERPVIGWGFSSPWVPSDDHFTGWLVDHGQTVMQAHNMWLDAIFQTGFIGAFLLGVVYAAALWRSWFFAVDRPRWDIVSTRPYARLSVLPILIITVLLVQSLTESNPMMLWGWMLVVAFSFKIKSAPIVGVGPAENTVERGLPRLSRR